MVEIWNENELKTWLEGRGEEDARAIAARASLRTLPLVSEIFTSSGQEPRANFVLPVLRATILSRFAALPKNRDNMIANAADSAAASAALSADSALSAARSAALSAAYSADSAARSAALSAARSAALSADSAAARSAAIWRKIAADVTSFDQGTDAATLAATPLWQDEPPEWVTEAWGKVAAALREAEDENWEFWIDWYEARLRGEPINDTLDRAIVLIDDDVWKQGPKVVNAKIAELVEEHRPTRSELEATVSPQPVIKEGKLDVQPNEKYDSANGSEELATLPTRQRAVIRALLAAVSGDRNTSPAVVVALEEYDTELLARGTRPMLGLLNDMHQIVRDEYRILNKEKFFESQGGLKRSFLAFTANHKTITKHFPLDIEREALVREAQVDLTAINPTELRERVDAVSTATQDAFDEGGVSDDYRKVMERLTEDMRRVAETFPSELDDDPDRSLLDPPEVPWWKRRIISMRGFAGKSVTRIAEGAGIWAFLETERGIALVARLRELLDFFWPTG